MPERKQYRVETLIQSKVLTIGDGYRAKNSELASTGIPFARVTNIDNGFQFADADLFPEDGLHKVGEKISRTGDVVFTSKGTVGRFALVRDDTPRFVYSPQLSYWRSLDFNVIEPRFVFYWMQGQEFWEQAAGVKSQTDMADYVSLSDQRKMKITIPSLPEQRAIARILGALDDKIELNRRMNATLEALAQALFKSWFVDFDPVTAKAEGRAPFGMSAEPAALFPAEFVDSELGAIPKGWRVGRVGDIGINTRRSIVPNQVDSETPYIGLEHMPRKSIALNEWGKAGDVVSNKFFFKMGDILFGKLRPYFHKVGVAAVDGVCSTDVLVVAPKQAEYFGVLLGHLASVEFINYVDAGSEGTKMPRTNWEMMARFPIAIPDIQMASNFAKILNPMVRKIHANIAESCTLASIRDALLPRLLSGELRVKGAPQSIQEQAA